MTKTITFQVGGPYISKSITVVLDEFPLNIIRDLCKECGIVEYLWYGLEFTAPDGMRSVLNNADKVGALMEELKSAKAKVELKLLYYPTSHTMVYQPNVKQHMMTDSLTKILDESVYAPPEMILNLLAHDLQYTNGDYEDLGQDKATKLIVHTVSNKISQDIKGRHAFEQAEWESSVCQMWKALRGFHRLDVVESFMDEVENLQMHNINYFVITNTKNSSVYVGVEATGISLYSLDDKQTPKVSFDWTELSQMEYKGNSLILTLKEKGANNENSKLIFRTSGKFQGYRIGAVVRGTFDNWRHYINKVNPRFREMRDEAMKIGEAVQEQKKKEVAESLEKTKEKITKSIEETKKADPIAARRVETVVNKLINVCDGGQDASNQLYEKLKDINKAATKNVSEETKKTIRMKRKVETSNDSVYEKQEKAAFTKFQTLAKLRVGNTRARVEQFESM